MGDRTATATAIADAAADAVAERARELGEQLDLLPTKFTAEAEPWAHGRQVDGVKRDRAGRPAGSRNVRTRDAVDFVRRVFGDPLIESARWLLHTPQMLALELGCTELEAFDRLEAIRKDLRQYVHPRLAPVDGQGNVVPPFLGVVLGGASGAPGVAGDDTPPWERWRVIDAQAEQNQGFSGDAAAVPHDDLPHGEAK